MKLVQRRDVLRVRDERHALRLLRTLRPELGPEHAQRMARDLAEGWALLVLEDDFEPLDEPTDHDDDLDPPDPWPDPDPPMPPPSPDPPADVTFIGLRVVDADGRAVGHLKYRLTLPGGATVDGQLDEEGAAHHDGLDPGDCYVVFEKRALGGPAPASPAPSPPDAGAGASFEEAPDDPLDDGETETEQGPVPEAVDEEEEVDEEGVPFDEE